jgi:hypothetical protein
MLNTCSNTSMYPWRTIFKKKISFSYLLTYQFRSFYWCKSFCGISDRSSVKWAIPKTEEHFHFIQALLAHFCKMLICPLLIIAIPSLRYACDWLQQSNPYLSAYHSIYLRIIPKHLLLFGLKQRNQFFRKWIHSCRAPSWDVVGIPCLDKQAFTVDQAVISEYERLENKP